MADQGSLVAELLLELLQHVLDGGARELSGDMRFRWKTFGVNLVTDVKEFEPVHRIAWLAKGFGVEAYHALLLTPTTDGGATSSPRKPR